MVRRRRRFSHAEPTVNVDDLEKIRSASRPLNSADDLNAILDQIGDARYVLLGEATHGTHEFYTWRAAISQRLIEEKGFSFIAVEGDWPDCYAVNRYIKGYADSGDSARDVLQTFQRWPTWMWANEEVAETIDWLRERNKDEKNGAKVGFYGLDVYSLWDSLYHVLGYLAKHDPSGLESAKRAFRCFEPYGEDVQEYARASRWVAASCEDQVVDLLTQLRRNAQPVNNTDGEAKFDAEQNALVVKNAEHYYRTMVRGGPESWNIRDRHMVETLEGLMQNHGSEAKAIVWEHNTHIGDARFTDMADDGMVNVGQLVRERHASEAVFLVGFSSYQGKVIAGRAWEAPMQCMEVPPGRSDSWEDLLHRTFESDRLVQLQELRSSPSLLEERGHRAVGVVYSPASEQYGNYVPSILPNRYDALVYLDTTTALRPLHGVQPDLTEVPETYPSGL